MAQDTYDKVLEPHVRLLRDASAPQFLFMDDNTRPHRSMLIAEFLESEDIQRMQKSASSLLLESD